MEYKETIVDRYSLLVGGGGVRAIGLWHIAARIERNFERNKINKSGLSRLRRESSLLAFLSRFQRANLLSMKQKKLFHVRPYIHFAENCARMWRRWITLTLLKCWINELFSFRVGQFKKVVPFLMGLMSGGDADQELCAIFFYFRFCFYRY